jgi:hypothetical protein
MVIIAARVLVDGFSETAVTIIVWLAEPEVELTVAQVSLLETDHVTFAEVISKVAVLELWKASVIPVGLTSREGAPSWVTTTE